MMPESLEELLRKYSAMETRDVVIRSAVKIEVMEGKLKEVCDQVTANDKRLTKIETVFWVFGGMVVVAIPLVPWLLEKYG